MPRSRSKPPSERRIRAERGGHRGEALAALFLQAMLYRIRERRYKTPVGEIDIVAEKAGTIVFVEVKARSANADEFLTFGSINHKRIARAAQFWLSHHPAEAGKDFRFDVILLAPGRWPRHLKNAFQLPG
jgi:putative endonuclease